MAFISPGKPITLITGRLPAPLHLAFTAVLRFQTRYACYLGMLTPTYPWRLFGDEPDASAPVTGAPAETGTPAESAWGTPLRGLTSSCLRDSPRTGPRLRPGPACVRHVPGYETTVGYTPASRHSPPSGYGSAQPASPPASWRPGPPQSAKTLLIVIIVLGLADVGIQIARYASAHKAANSKIAATSQSGTPLSRRSRQNGRMARRATAARA